MVTLEVRLGTAQEGKGMVEKRNEGLRRVQDTLFPHWLALT